MTIDAPELQNIIVQIEQLPAQRYLTFGEFHGEDMSTEKDFKLVEWNLTDEEIRNNEIIGVING